MPSHWAIFALPLALAMKSGAASAAEWRIDPTASRLTFIAIQAGKPLEGSFEAFSATIRFDDSDLAAAKAIVVIDMASAKTGNAQADSALKVRIGSQLPATRRRSSRQRRSGTSAAIATRPMPCLPFATSPSRW